MPLYTEDTATRSFLPLDEIPSTFSDVIEAQFGQTLTELPLVAGARLTELTMARRQGTTLPKADALGRIDAAGLAGHLNVDDNGITDAALDILMDRKREELQIQQTLARARGGVGEGAARLGVALGTSLLDPVNVGLAFVPVVGEARYARILAGAGGLFGRATVRAGVGAIEGAAGAAIIEPLIYTAKQQEQADYDMSDSLMNIAFGTIFGGGLHVVGGAGADLVRGFRGEKPIRIEDVRADFPDIKAESPPAKEVAATRVLSEADAPAVVGYTTSRGSTYEIQTGGVTVRDKAARPEHPGDSGIQPASESTYYVTTADAQRLGEFQTIGSERAIVPIGDSQIGMRYEDGVDAGKFERRTVVTAQRQPAIGLVPVETWKGGRIVHFGNEIVSVRRADGAIETKARETAVDAQTRAADASTQVREAALRTAVGQMADGKPVRVEPLFAGDRQNIVMASAREASALDPDAPRQVEAAKAIDDEIAQSNTQLEAAEEEAALAESLLNEQAKFYDIEPKDAATEAAAALTKQAERWSRVAELATACLIRGA